MTDHEREEWLKERRTGIGASDAPAICGVSPWATPLHVYRHKTASINDQQVIEYEKFIDIDSPLGIGTVIEPSIAQMYAIKMQVTLQKPKPIERHEMVSWMLCSRDYCYTNNDGEHITVECKNASSRAGWGTPGTDQVPAHYYIQAQHQMEVTGTNVVHFAVLFGGRDFEVYVVERDEEVIDQMLLMEHSFWRRVEQNDAPEPDFEHPETPDLLKKLYQRVDKRTIDLGDLAVPLVEEYMVAKQEAEDALNRKDVIKSKLLAMMGNAEKATVSNGVTMVRIVKNVTEYVSPAKRYVEMRINPPPKPKKGSP